MRLGARNWRRHAKGESAAARSRFPRLDDSMVILELAREGLIDKASGTLFDPFIGRGISGPLEDQMLDRLPAFTAFPDDYLTFYPDGRIWP